MIKVLVVDDSALVRSLMSEIIRGAQGFILVGAAPDAYVARDMVKEFSPDVITLDIEMPRMDGFELLAQLRAQDQWKKLPIIMISSRTAPKHREHAESLGATDFLGKPYQNDVLLETVQTVLQQQKTAEAV